MSAPSGARRGNARDPMVEIEVGINGDTAAALGQAGRRLAAALDALRGTASGDGRGALVQAAADALWSFVVQREAVGVTDHAPVMQAYGVTKEVWRCMGAMHRDVGAALAAKDRG